MNIKLLNPLLGFITVLCVALEGCAVQHIPDPTPIDLRAPCVKPLNGVWELYGISITSDGTKALVNYRHGYEMRMFIADLPTASVTRKYFGSPSELNGLQWDTHWMGDSKTRFWGTMGGTIGELDENLARSNAQLCKSCLSFSVSKSGRFAVVSNEPDWHTTIYDQVGGKEIAQMPSGGIRMNFSPDDRYLSKSEYKSTRMMNLVTKQEFYAPRNDLNPAWLDNVTILMPDETQPIIWTYNVETGKKNEFAKLNPMVWEEDQHLVGVSGNGDLRYVVIMTDNKDLQNDLHVVDMGCLRKSPN